MKLPDPLDADDVKPGRLLLGLAVSGLVGSVLFVLLWAGLNFAFGSALDGPIGIFIMEPPCQRLARTSEPLLRYTFGSGHVRLSSPVCHFASGSVWVEGSTDGLGFTGRELAYLVVGFVGYAVCFVAALVGAFYVVRAGRRVLARQWLS
jgi:hypothetical protein